MRVLWIVDVDTVRQQGETPAKPILMPFGAIISFRSPSIFTISIRILIFSLSLFGRPNRIAFPLNRTGSKNLLKWKGVMFATDIDDKTISEQATTTTSSEPDSSCCTTIATNPTPATEKDFDAIATDDDGHQVNGYTLYILIFISFACVLYIDGITFTRD